MPLFRRPDGKLAKDVPPFRRIMPFIMRHRNESAAYLEQEIDLTRTQRFIDAFNARSARKISFFHLYLWAAVQGLHQRPRINRFVAGNRIYDRDGIWVSFSAKKSMSDDAPVVVLKRRIDPAMPFAEMVAFLHLDVEEGRSEKKSHVDKELSLFLRLPSPILRVGVALLRLLDDWNLLPGSFIKGDPLYASLFIANLGSLKMDAVYHHLYEYGNIPVFACIGRRREVPVVVDGKLAVRTVCSVKYTYDERVEDGLYGARGLDLVRQICEDPEAHGCQLPAEAAQPAATAS